MSERAAPWRSKPPQEVVDLLQLLGQVQVYLVQRPGPTSFLVREEGSEVKRRVQIGSRITCSCSGPGPTGTCKELCLHSLFVMVKVLRVPASNPLVWQLSLNDRELEEVLRCAVQPERAPPPEKPRQGADKAVPGQVKRKALDEEEPCPICYEDMVGQDLDNLVWCRYGCGRNVHGKCMGVWAEHQVNSLGKELTCPLCRGEWGEFKWRPPPPKRRTREERKDVHYGTHCGACKRAPLVGKRYRCVICVDLDLCEGCFNEGHHPQHPFAVKDSPKAFGVPADRPTMMPTIARLAAATAGPGAGAGAGAAGGVAAGGGGAAAGPASSTGVPSTGGPRLGAASPEPGGVGGGSGVRHAQRRQSDMDALGREAGADGVLGVALGVGLGAGAGGAQQQQQHGGRVGAATGAPGGGAPGAPRHPLRGLTVGRGALAARVGPPAGPHDGDGGSLEARLAARPSPLLAVEGLTVGGGPGLAVAGVDMNGVVEMVGRRPAPGGGSKPVVVRRAKSTAHERQGPAGQGPGAGAIAGIAGGLGAEGAGGLCLGLAGVHLGAGGPSATDSGAAGCAAAGAFTFARPPQAQQQGSPAVPTGMPPRHPVLPTRVAGGAAPWVRGPTIGPTPRQGQPVHGLTGAVSGVGAAGQAQGPGPAAALVLHGRLLGDAGGGGAGPPRPPGYPVVSARGPGDAGAGGGPGRQGKRQQPQLRHGPAPLEQRGPGLRRVRSAGHQGAPRSPLVLNARAVAPLPLTPETPGVQYSHPAAAGAAAAPSHGTEYDDGYDEPPYDECYSPAVAIQLDDHRLLAFSHNLPGPGASRSRSFGVGNGNGDGIGGRRASGAAEEVGEDEGLQGSGQGGADHHYYGNRYTDDYVLDEEIAEEEFPHGPATPHMQLFSSRPNTVPTESGFLDEEDNDPPGEIRDEEDTARGVGTVGGGVVGSRGGTATSYGMTNITYGRERTVLHSASFTCGTPSAASARKRAPEGPNTVGGYDPSAGPRTGHSGKGHGTSTGEGPPCASGADSCPSLPQWRSKEINLRDSRDCSGELGSSPVSPVSPLALAAGLDGRTASLRRADGVQRSHVSVGSLSPLTKQPLCSPVRDSAAAGGAASRLFGGPVGRSASSINRDSVLLGSVAVDSVDEFMSSLRRPPPSPPQVQQQQQQPSVSSCSPGATHSDTQLPVLHTFGSHRQVDALYGRRGDLDSAAGVAAGYGGGGGAGGGSGDGPLYSAYGGGGCGRSSLLPPHAASVPDLPAAEDTLGAFMLERSYRAAGLGEGGALGSSSAKMLAGRVSGVLGAGSGGGSGSGPLQLAVATGDEGHRGAMRQCGALGVYGSQEGEWAGSPRSLRRRSVGAPARGSESTDCASPRGAGEVSSPLPSFTAFSNPAFNRPYTLDMSFGGS